MPEKIVVCVPNYSEGRDLYKVEQIADVFRGRANVKLLNYEADPDYNRTVITIAGEPQAVKKAVVDSVGVACKLIDLRQQSGEHLRMGATDVVPFIPIKGMTMDEAVVIAQEAGAEIAQEHQVPVFLYEYAASTSCRQNLADIRKGQFEGMAEKMKNSLWLPDFGEPKIHPSAGVTAVGARKPLIAYNIDLDTDNVEIANKIARAVRYSNGGYRCLKAYGVATAKTGKTQVTINLVDYQTTAIYQAFEAVKMEARRYGVNVCGSEIIGLVPMEALIDTAAYYLGLHDFDMTKVLENALLEIKEKE